MASNFEFYSPTRVIFGKGTEQRVGALVREYGGTRVLIVYGGKSAVRSGVLDRAENSLAEAGISSWTLGGVVPNPHLDKVYEGIRIGKENSIDFLLAVGGGSVIDTAKAIADKLGVSMKIVDMSFDNLLMSLANDEFDLVIAGLTADEERRKTTDFSDPYLESKNLILVRAEDADKYASLDDLKGVKGGAQTGSKPYNNCVTYCGEETTVGLAKVQDLVMELEAGKLDVVFLDYMTVLSYADAKEDLAAVDLGIPETSDGYSIAVKKGNTELAEFINGVLAELKEQNAIEQFIVEAKKLESAAE